MGPKDKFEVRKWSHRRGFRRLLLGHYFPYLYRGVPKPEDKQTVPRNVLSFEYQLRKQSLQHPNLLAYHILLLL